MPLFDRVVSVLIGEDGAEEALNVTDLRVSFEVKKTAKPETNSCKTSIWNLSPDQRNRISTTDGTMMLKAGHAQDVGLKVLYIGDIAFAEHKRQPPDIVTVLEGQDGFKAMSETRLALSYKEGTGAKQILKDVLGQFGLAARTTVKQLLSDTPDSEYTSGFSATGQGKDVLVKLTSKLSLEWSVQNHEIKLLREGGTDGSAAILISPTTGLIGSPQRRRQQTAGATGYNGWSLKCLLQPQIEPGGTVEIESADIPAGSQFRVETITHRGDTHTNAWESQLEVTDVR